MLLTALFSRSQREHTVQQDTIKGVGDAADTIIIRNIDLFAGQRGKNRYKIEDTAVRILKPYFITDMVDPFNLTHPIYLAHMKEGREKLEAAKVALLRNMNSSENTRAYMRKLNINNEADINSLKYVQVPSYYLAPNIVNFQNGDNVGKYYNLGTGAINYLMFRQNKLIGFLQFYNNRSAFRIVPHYLAEGYYMAKKLGKNPIMLSQVISIIDPMKITLAYDNFGFADQGYLFYSHYQEWGYSYYDHVPKRTFYKKEYLIKTADSYISKPAGLSSVVEWVEKAVRNIKLYKS